MTTYLCYSNEILLHQGPQFKIKEFQNLLSEGGIILSDAGIDSHNSSDENERYHAFIGNMYKKVRSEHPYMEHTVLLKLAVKA